MKATALLKQQHDEVKAIFKSLEHGNGNAQALLDKLATSLAAHMVIEQTLFYPAMIDVKEDLVLESYEEHAVARFALKRVLKADRGDASFKAKITTLRELIDHHVVEEEQDLFPKAEKVLGEGSEALAMQMKELFDATVEQGYDEVLGKGGSAVKSASAPGHHHHA